MKVAPLRVSMTAMVFILGFFCLSSPLAAQVPDELAGNWIMDDFSPSLLYPANKPNFSILRASPGKSQWADGFFFMRWPSSVSPERGYYSLKTGRVWVTTYRWVNQKEERVEYRGTVKRNKKGDLVWTGSAKTTGRPMTTWKFEAVKQ
ncbi:hypothetical protein N9023_01400 [Opitutaceae bacterium]|nr:hypothetical protein [Opitutaceae bacterium]